VIRRLQDLFRGVARTKARALMAATLVLSVAAGCERRVSGPVRAPAVPLPLQVLADTGRTRTLPVPPPAVARAWLERVQRDRPPRVPPAEVTPAPVLSVPPPEARPEAPPLANEPVDVLVVDDDLHPPIPIGTTPVQLPSGRGRMVGVDLDVRVDESGAVSDAVWAGGSQDSAAVAAVTTCALAMRFHPAIQHGRPVAVWCRQHFEFGAGLAAPAEDEPRH
jgi:hypothetical protein